MLENSNTLQTQILYEDADIIAINKQATQLVQADKSNNPSLLDGILQYLKQSKQVVFCEVVHRLDRPVSGVVIFAKTKEALADLNKQFQNHQVEKIYWAIVTKKPMNEKAILVDFVAKNEKLNKSYIVDANSKNALKAELQYRIIAESDRYCLVEINPKTGRHHQIRVQLANIGCPIKGDLKYGFNRSNKDSSISLHAQKVTFSHPTKKKKVSIIAGVPQDTLWKYFEEIINK